MEIKKRLPRIVIVGRANVGKSTLFNKLIEKPFSIVKKPLKRVLLLL